MEPTLGEVGRRLIDFDARTSHRLSVIDAKLEEAGTRAAALERHLERVDARLEQHDKEIERLGRRDGRHGGGGAIIIPTDSKTIVSLLLALASLAVALVLTSRGGA